MKVWISGQVHRKGSEMEGWQFRGVFETKQEAVEVCQNRDSFIFSAELNQSYFWKNWPGPDCLHPLAMEVAP